ncbi:hypothetical protein FQZ97_824920 [compost metagenome]
MGSVSVALLQGVELIEPDEDQGQQLGWAIMQIGAATAQGEFVDTRECLVRGGDLALQADVLCVQQGLFLHLAAERMLLPHNDPFATVHDGEQQQQHRHGSGAYDDPHFLTDKRNFLLKHFRQFIKLANGNDPTRAELAQRGINLIKRNAQAAFIAVFCFVQRAPFRYRIPL